MSQGLHGVYSIVNHADTVSTCIHWEGYGPLKFSNETMVYSYSCNTINGYRYRALLTPSKPLDMQELSEWLLYRGQCVPKEHHLWHHKWSKVPSVAARHGLANHPWQEKLLYMVQGDQFWGHHWWHHGLKCMPLYVTRSGKGHHLHTRKIFINT